MRCKHFNICKLIAAIMVFDFIALWIVWPLPETIAARNIALYLGAILALFWLIKGGIKFSPSDLISISLPFFIFLWLLILYFFSPVDKYIQLADLRGTWVRAILGVIFAIGLAKSLQAFPGNWGIVLFALLIWPIVSFLLYFYNALALGEWHLYGYKAIFKSKIAAVFFLTWTIALIFSYFHYLTNGLSIKKQSKNIKITYIVVSLSFLIFIDTFLINSLNQFITIFISFIFLIFIATLKSHKDIGLYSKYIRVFFYALIFIVFLIGVLVFDQKYSSGKLSLVPKDIAYIMLDDKTGAWKWDGKYDGVYPPLNSRTGLRVNDSTYERVSWYREGMKILISHPFGIGYSHRAFAYYMEEQYPGSRATKTHSGWLDFALGTGVVPLFCIWFAMILIARRSLLIINRDPHSYNVGYYSFWAITMNFVLWHIGELSEREYLEVLFASIGFLSIALSLVNDKN